MHEDTKKDIVFAEVPQSPATRAAYGIPDPDYSVVKQSIARYALIHCAVQHILDMREPDCVASKRVIVVRNTNERLNDGREAVYAVYETGIRTKDNLGVLREGCLVPLETVNAICARLEAGEMFTKEWAGRCHPLGWRRNAHENTLGTLFKVSCREMRTILWYLPQEFYKL